MKNWILRIIARLAITAKEPLPELSSICVDRGCVILVRFRHPLSEASLNRQIGNLKDALPEGVHVVAAFNVEGITVIYPPKIAVRDPLCAPHTAL